MKSWQVTGPKQIELVEITKAEQEKKIKSLVDPPIKIKTTFAGLSYLDKKIYNGQVIVEYPFTLASSAVGIISDDIYTFKRGERVVVDPYTICGKCYHCKTESEVCANVSSYSSIFGGGALSDFSVFPRENIYPIPESVKDEDALFVEHIAISLNALDTIKLQKGEYVAIFSAGVTGNICAQIALYYQAIPILIDVDNEKLEVAKNKGIFYTINAKTEDVFKRINEITSKRGSEASIYIVNNGFCEINDSFKVVEDFGRVCILGEAISTNLQGNAEIILDRILTVSGVKSGYKSIAKAINILANKGVSASGLVRRYVSFNDAGKIIEEMSKENVPQFKTIVKC
jgi:threonine dehydrogenase-like Zn-dependent dehydrogenase